MPNTKPNLSLDEDGVCTACRNYENRDLVDWNKRKNELVEILEKYKSKSGTNWDCIIPVSGGKDSTYQVIKMLEFGMNPLCVMSTTCNLSEIGRYNIENIKKLGVDYIEFTGNPKVRCALNRYGLIEVGDISLPEHMGIFTVPIRIAVQFKIPLIIWGENPQNEYGGPASSSESKHLDREWLNKFGGLLGMNLEDLIGYEGIEKKDLISYSYPSDNELKEVGVTGIFLGYYQKWDGLTNYLISQGQGFKGHNSIVEGSIVNYENLDNLQTGIHDYFKYLKYGFGRASDIASLQIRRGILTREDAVKLVENHDGKFPWTYLDISLEDILKPLKISTEEFISICDRFTNLSIFLKNEDGSLFKDESCQLKKIKSA